MFLNSEFLEDDKKEYWICGICEENRGFIKEDTMRDSIYIRVAIPHSL
jgi:hypothetical protein